MIRNRGQSFYDAADIKDEIENIAAKRGFQNLEVLSRWEVSDPVHVEQLGRDKIGVRINTNRHSISHVVDIAHGVAGRWRYRVSYCEKGNIYVRKYAEHMVGPKFPWTAYAILTLDPLIQDFHSHKYF